MVLPTGKRRKELGNWNTKRNGLKFFVKFQRRRL
jgi:hypothetical protein